jgi:ABC-2 type transport system permease protein
MFGLAVRALLLRGRTAALALLPLFVGVVALAIALLASERNLEGVYATLGADLLISVVVALVALVLGVNAFDDEREGGTLPLLMATATARWRIVGAKLAAAWISTVLVCLPAVVGCAVLGTRAGLGAGEVWGSLLLAVAASSAGYVALFVLMSLLSRRSLLIGLAYVLVWEGLLATYATALKNLSIGAYGRRITGAPWDAGDVPFTAADVGIVAAALGLVALAAVGFAAAARRLPQVDATG